MQQTTTVMTTILLLGRGMQSSHKGMTNLLFSWCITAAFQGSIPANKRTHEINIVSL